MQDRHFRELRILRLCIWMIVPYCLLWGALLIARIMPPWGADVPASVLAAWYRSDRNVIAAATVVMMIPAALYVMFGLAIGRIMQEAAGPRSILAEMEIFGAALGAMVGLLAMWVWMAGAYRALDLPDYMLQLLYDAGWLMLDVAFPITSLQIIGFGVGFLQDDRQVPLVPKWACWYSIWIGFGFAGEGLVPFFKHGAFARDGLFNFWIEYGIFFIWFPIVLYFMLQALSRLEGEARAGVSNAHTS
jgi:hypothetical protein